MGNNHHPENKKSSPSALVKITGDLLNQLLLGQITSELDVFNELEEVVRSQQPENESSLELIKLIELYKKNPTTASVIGLIVHLTLL